MAPLLVLLGVFGATIAWLRLRRGRWLLAPAGRAAAAAMFVFTGVSHFPLAESMAAMVPPAVPAPLLVVYATGVLEILGGIGLLVPRTRRAAAWCLALFLVAVFPANVYAALNRVGLGGHADGPGYLWLRAPLQVFFLAWVVGFGLVADRPRKGE